MLISTTFVVKPACGETNSIDFSGFYREWAISPSNALVQIKPPLMALAASSKTNVVDQAVLRNSLWHLFSTNALFDDERYLQKMKQTLIVDAFKTSGTYSTPQEKEIVALVKALAFLRDSFTPNVPFPIEYLEQEAYEAMVQKLIDNGAARSIWSRGFSEIGMELPYTPTLIMPSGNDPEETWTSYRKFRSIQYELHNMNSDIFYEMSYMKKMVRELPQEERGKIFAEIVALQTLDHDEECRIARDMGVDPTAVQTQPTSTE